MAPMKAINDLATVTPDGNLNNDAFSVGTGDNGAGSDNVINGFFTDINGDGRTDIVAGALHITRSDNDTGRIGMWMSGGGNDP